MKCFLDNIIFALQRSGGASVVWIEHINRLLKEKNCDSFYIDYRKSLNNIFRKGISIPDNQIKYLSDRYLFLNRYLDLTLSEKEKHIFHSSHYRLDKNKYALNITTVHDFTYEKYVSGIRRVVHSFQKNHAIQGANAIICVSHSTKNDLLHYLPNVDKKKIHVIYNGVNTCFKNISSSEYKLLIPFHDKEYILYVGMRSPKYKNFSVVVELCRETHIPLIIVGGEKLEDRERKFLNTQLGANGYKHYCGIDSESLNELYNRALVFLYPSIYEGFGIPVIEAQKSGCPVIAFNNSSIPEVMGKSNFLINNTSLKHIITCIHELEKIHIRYEEIERGLENSNRFSWDLTYKNTYNLYNEIYNKK